MWGAFASSSFALYRFIYVLLRTIKETDIYLLDFKVHVSALVLIYGEIILLCLMNFSIYKVSYIVWYVYVVLCF